MKKSLNKTMQIASVAAASLLVVYIGIAAATASMNTTNTNQTSQDLDWSAILTPADAATVDYFLKIDGVVGESTVRGHEGEIDVLSWSWGATNSGSLSTGTGGGGGAGKVSISDLHITTTTTKASPILFLKCATGEHIKEAVLTARKAGSDSPQEYLIIKFTDVVISSYSTSGSSGGDIPSESISLNFAKIDIEYKPQKPDGTFDTSVKASYDLAKAKKV